MQRAFDVIDAPQRSDTWFRARAGRLTGSAAADMLAKIKSGEAAGRRDLRVRLVVERLTGEPQESGFLNADMQRGIELEPAARAAYEAVTGAVVQETGFLASRDKLIGCSLDGHVGDFAGIVELKVPKSATHWEYLRAGELPARYRPQVMHNLLVSGAEWCDFLSFDPRFPESMQTFYVRVLREDVDMNGYARAVDTFLAEVEAEYQAAHGWRAAKGAAA